MNENEVPSLEEIKRAFDRHCDYKCETCKFFKCGTTQSTCKAYYTYSVLTGKMKLTDSFHEIPAWCKVGQWVTKWDSNLRALGVVEEADGVMLTVKWIKNELGEKVSQSAYSWFKPIRFRPYTFEEAKELLGEVMEYDDSGILPAAALIGMVTRDSMKIYLNGSDFDTLKDWNAIIDGVSIGVPEVDEEALKGGQE